MLIIPSIDLEAGRSRVVFWPGAAAGIGAPTDRPERIVEQLVGQGAKLIHLIDFDGARSGAPGNLDAVGAIASRSAVPLQLAGGVDSPEAIQLAFAMMNCSIPVDDTRASRRKTGQSTRQCCRRSRIRDVTPNRIHNCIPTPRVRPMIVATAAPVTPIAGIGPNPKISTGSSTRFSAFATHSTRIAISASPAPRNTAFSRNSIMIVTELPRIQRV